MTEIGMKIGFS